MGNAEYMAALSDACSSLTLSFSLSLSCILISPRMSLQLSVGEGVAQIHGWKMSKRSIAHLYALSTPNSLLSIHFFLPLHYLSILALHSFLFFFPSLFLLP